MCRASTILCSALLLVIATGCSSVQASREEAAPPEAVRRALLLLPAERRCSVTISPDERPRAYAWKDGRIVLTAGLLRLLNEQEIAAAIAHEMGHMAADGRLQTVVSLTGCGADLKGEFLADELGCRILSASGLPPDAMATMLEKVRSSPATDPECRELMLRRIEQLRALNTTFISELNQRSSLIRSD